MVRHHVMKFGWPIFLAILVLSTFLIVEQIMMFCMLNNQHDSTNFNDDLIMNREDDDSTTSTTVLRPPTPTSVVEVPQKSQSPPVHQHQHQQHQRLIIPPARNETAVICMIAKNEDTRIEEWTDYHLGIGFSAIFIYDNSETNELNQWGMERHDYYGDPVFVKHFPGKAKQFAAYRDCSERVVSLNHTWVMFIDGDEFLVIKDRNKFPHVVDMLQVYAPKGELVLWWRLFGSSDRQNYEPIPVTKRFQYRVEDNYQMNHQFKSITHVAELDVATKNLTSPHWMPVKKGVNLFSTDGKFPIQKDGVGPDDVAVIHHYNFNSRVELMRKRLRGSSYSGTQKWLETAKKGQTQNGDPIPKGSILDDIAWRTLKDVAPRYAVYDDFYDNYKVKFWS